jgi:hypothetical protein
VTASQLGFELWQFPEPLASVKSLDYSAYTCDAAFPARGQFGRRFLQLSAKAANLCASAASNDLNGITAGGAGQSKLALLWARAAQNETFSFLLRIY